jgi:DNA polymerase III subunit alpha
MIKVIKEVSIKDLENWIYNVNIEDPNIYKELSNSNKIGIFQISGSSAEKLCNEVKPENFDEIIAVNALSRPGPMEAAAPFYVERKNGTPSPYPQVVNDLIKDTHNTFIYQEQIMEIFHKIGGFSLEDANEVRNLMKKLGKLEKDPDDVKKWERTVKKFTAGATKNGISEDMAKKIANDLSSFSGYSFNKAHATSYAYIAAITAYFSYYFRPYFYSSTLTYEVDREKYLLDRLYSVKNQDIEILPPDINKSATHFSPINDKQIIFGLSDIKYVSETATEMILANRPYKDLFDFIIKTRSRNVTSRVIVALISIGAFDFISKERKKMIHLFESFWDKKGGTKIEEKLKNLYDTIKNSIDYLPGLETAEADYVAYEKEYIGFRFFSSPFTNKKTEAFREMRRKFLIYFTLAEVGRVSKKVPVCINSVRPFKDKNGNMMAFMDVEDLKGNNISIPVFQSYYKYLASELQENYLYLMNIYMGDDGKLIFGRDEWMKNPDEIKRLVKRI